MLMRSPRQLGFTLTELMTVVMILAVMMALAAPSFNTWVNNGHVRNAAEEIQNGLQQARSEAVQQNLSNSIAGTIVGDPGMYTIPAAPIVGATKAQLTVTPNGTTVVAFNGLGRQLTPGVTVSIDIDNPTNGTCVAAGGRIRCLRVLVTTLGQVRMCDPSRPATDPQGCP